MGNPCARDGRRMHPVGGCRPASWPGAGAAGCSERAANLSSTCNEGGEKRARRGPEEGGSETERAGKGQRTRKEGAGKWTEASAGAGDRGDEGAANLQRTCRERAAKRVKNGR